MGGWVAAEGGVSAGPGKPVPRVDLCVRERRKPLTPVFDITHSNHWKMLMNDTLWPWLAKLAGAVAGSAISLAYILPTDRREAAVRFAVGLVCGLVFGGTAGLKIATELGIAQTIGSGETALMGAAAASLCAWWGLGLLKRAFGGGRIARIFKGGR